MQTTMPAPHPTWDTALERFEKWRRLQGVTERYLREQLRLLNEAREWFDAAPTAHELTEEEVLAFFQGLRTRGLSTRSRSEYASALRMFMRYTGAPAQRWIPSFPIAPPQDNGRYLDDEERNKLWRACRTPEDELILVMGLGSGFRRSDMLGLRLEDLQPSQQAPTSVIFHGKGEKFYKVQIEIHPKLGETLVKYLPWREAKIATGVSMKGLDFRDPGTVLISTGYHLGIKAMGRTALDTRIRELYELAGVDPGGWPLHNLRRTWADNRLEALLGMYQQSTSSPIMALDMAIRQLQFEGRWKSAETVRRYLRRREKPTEASWTRMKI